MIRPKSQTKWKKQKGAAIIVALFVTSIAAAMAVAMMMHLHVDTRRAEFILNDIQIKAYAEGSITWAIDQLNTDLKNKKDTQLVDPIPIQSQLDHLSNGMQIQSRITDAEALFNINSLMDDANKENFQRLIIAAVPNIDPAKAKQLVDATYDWIFPLGNDQTLRDDYAKLNPPYVAAHAPMACISEWRLVHGVTPEIYNQLAPYLTAFPVSKLDKNPIPINVNTASALVLMSLIPGLNQSAAEAIVLQRKTKPFLQAGDFLGLDVVKNLLGSKDITNQITVMSGYFFVKTSVTLGQDETILNTLLKRNAVGSEADTNILWQLKGSLSC